MSDFVFFIELKPNDYKVMKCSSVEPGLTIGDLLDIVSTNLKVDRKRLKVFNQYQIREKREIDDSVTIQDMQDLHYLINISLCP